MREKVRNFVDGKWFTSLVFILIALNTISLGIETFKLSDIANQALSTFNTVCIIVFVLEIVLKLYAYGLSFFKDPWNIFDTFIVIVSILPMITFLSSMRAFRIFRMFRALRALRMMKRLEKLRVIVQALLGALPSVAWVVVLLVIIYYVFGVIGTNLFASLSPEFFGTLWKSLYTLFQITMADDLGEISRPLLESGVGAIIYFISFVVLSTVLVLNVIVGVVVDSVSEIKKSTQKDGENNKLEENINHIRQSDNYDELKNANLEQEVENLEQQLKKIKSILALKEQK